MQTTQRPILTLTQDDFAQIGVDAAELDEIQMDHIHSLLLSHYKKRYLNVLKAATQLVHKGKS